MKKLVTLLLVCTMLCLAVALVGCNKEGGNTKECTTHTWEVSTTPTYNAVGALKCKNCSATQELPTLKRENYPESSRGESSYTVGYIIDGQRFSFEQSYFLYEEIDANTVSLISVLENYNNKICIPDSLDGKSVTKIKASAFDMAREENWQIHGVSIPATVTEIEENALSGLNWMSGGGGNTTIEFPLSFTMRDLFGENIPSEIYEVVFNGGDTIRTETLQGSSVGVYNIPSTVTKIEENAFIDCANQSGIQVKYAGTIAQWCNIDFENEYSNPFFRRDSSSFCLLDENDNYVGVTELTIPEGVTEIKAFAFVGFPAAKIEIPASVTKIGDYAFYKSKITSINVPNGVVELGTQSFSNCYDVSTITLGNGIATLGADPFYHTSNVKNLYFMGTAAQLETLKYNDNLTYEDSVLWRFSEVPAHIYAENVDLQQWSLGVSIWHYDETGNPKAWNVVRQDYYFGDDKYTYEKTEIEITDAAWSVLLSKKGTDELKSLLNNNEDLIAAFNESSAKAEFISKAEALFATANQAFYVQFGRTGVIDHFTDGRTNNKHNFKAFSVEGVFGAYSYDEYELYLTETAEDSISLGEGNEYIAITHILKK